jgi:hypothetical protein
MMQYAFKAATFAATLMVGLGSVSLASAADRNRHNDGPDDDFRLYLNRAIDQSGEDPCHAGEVYQGSGSPNTGWARKRNADAGIELAMKAIMRQGADIPASYVDGDGIVHFEVPTGTQMLPAPNTGRAAWNFNYSYNVGLADGPRLDAYDIELWIDVDPSQSTNYLKLNLAKLGPAAASVACPGAEPDANGYGWKAADGSVVPVGSTVIPDDEGTDRVTQNSQNLAFYKTLIDGDSHTAGHQDYAFTPGFFDVVMIVKKKQRNRPNRNEASDTVLHLVFDVVDGTAQPDNVGP